jgi:lipopolysaccharide export system permease protein
VARVAGRPARSPSWSCKAGNPWHAQGLGSQSSAPEGRCGRASAGTEAGVFFSILNRTIFLELVKVFAMALVGITGLLLLAGVVSEASKEGLGPQQILAVVPLIVPGTLPYTIPATTLFASCVIYGRLAADNEILAIKSAGVNVLRVIGPGLCLGVAATGITFGLYYGVIPATHHLLRTLFLYDIEGLLYGVLEREHCFRNPRVDYEIHVKKVQGRKLIDAQFMHQDATRTRYNVIARAQEAELRWDKKNQKILVHMRYCHIWTDKSNTAFVEDKIWPVDLPEDLTRTDKSRPSDMTWVELLQAREAKVRTIEGLKVDVANQVARLALRDAPDDLPLHISNLRVMTKQREAELRDLDIELHRRPSLALGCLCFVLVGCPVGIWFSRSDYLSAFVSCFLPIVLLYYPLLLCGMNLAHSGTAWMLGGIWLANAFVGLISLELYRRLLKN